MPKLQAFLLCEKIIVDKQETPTLVGIIQKVTAQLTPGTESTAVPANAMAPMAWAIYAVWEFDAAEDGRALRQKTQVILPDQSAPPELKGELPFVAKTGLNNNYINIFGFPIGQTGLLKVKTWLETSEGQVITPEYYYPVFAEHKLTPLGSPNVEVAPQP